ncbi:MAG TPA: hypothetical protein VFE90_18435, partial [Myxococcales bacterium]|nr:hypothetical protein [Myxococcales bacterium]
WESLALLLLFGLQFAFPGTAVRLGFAAAYAALAVAILVQRRHELPRIAKATFSLGSASAPTG